MKNMYFHFLYFTFDLSLSKTKLSDPPKPHYLRDIKSSETEKIVFHKRKDTVWSIFWRLHYQLKDNVKSQWCCICVSWCVNITAVPLGNMQRWKKILDYYTEVILRAIAALNVNPTKLVGEHQTTKPWWPFGL